MCDGVEAGWQGLRTRAVRLRFQCQQSKLTTLEYRCCMGRAPILFPFTFSWGWPSNRVLKTGRP